MTYIITFVIIIVAAGALLLFRQPVETTVEPATVSIETELQIPEGFTPPTTPPPVSNTTKDDATVEIDTTAGVDTAPTISSDNEETTPVTSSDSSSPLAKTYTGESSYFTPNRTEHDIKVTLKLENERIIDANVTYDDSNAQTPNHIKFDEAYAAVVVGQNINELKLSRVGGASLTSEAFNEAVVGIKSQL